MLLFLFCEDGTDSEQPKHFLHPLWSLYFGEVTLNVTEI